MWAGNRKILLGIALMGVALIMAFIFSDNINKHINHQKELSKQEEQTQRQQQLEQRIQQAKNSAPQQVSVFSFEDEVPPYFIADGESELSISERKYKDGTSSLQWTFSEGSALTIYHPIGMTSIDRDTFGIWIYSDQPIDDELLFEFGQDEQTKASFKFRLNYQGWRTAWVPFRDMTGTPVEGMNSLKITAPHSVSQGRIYIDQIVMATPVDVRYPTRDAQVPFVNVSRDTSPSGHWQALLLYEQLLPDTLENVVITPEERAGIDRLREQMIAHVSEPSNVTEGVMQKLRSVFREFGISKDEAGIRGKPVDLVHIKDIYPAQIAKQLNYLVGGVDVKDYTDFMLEVANRYHGAEAKEYRSELKEMFVDLALHLKDQGWDAGHSLGTNHHLGYNIRSLYPSLLLMKDVLDEEGLLSWAEQTMRWFSGLGRIFEPLEETYANIDILNTKLQGMLAAILMKDQVEEQVFYLRRLSDWLSVGLLPAPGLMPALKPDGSGFHHMGFYPAYARDAYMGLAPVVMLLSDTPFRITEKAHKQLKQAVLAMRLYANRHEWLLSVSGRHPTGKERLHSDPYKYLALAGTPDRSEEIDPDMAAAYLRLVEPENVDAITRSLREKGYSAERAPSGHWTMNYGTLSLHRRADWLVGVRGHNRYFWAGELYSNANWYGRYTTYGQIQIMSQDGNLFSGFSHDGWDWNRWPGTTAIRLPLEELKAASFTEMLLTDETYAGGLHLQGENGMFAMKLHEHPKYDDSHRARKSVFMFDDRVIALGSDIKNTDEVHPTETTLFQSYLTREEDPIWVGKEAVTSFPFEERLELTDPMWLMDNKQNGYYVPAGQRIGVHKLRQQSKHQRNGQNTHGNFATAWLDHGTAPQGGKYEYAILIGADPARMQKFTALMEYEEQAPYKVLQQDRNAHIVQDRETGITAYALFEANEAIQHGVVAAVDTPSMVMIRDTNEGLLLSAVDPDLRFYEGIDEEQYDQEGNFIGRFGPYDRPWRENESQKHTITLTLVGEWVLEKPGDAYRITAYKQGQTVLEIDSKDAMPVELQLLLKNAN